jgi:hypothetical protein
MYLGPEILKEIGERDEHESDVKVTDKQNGYCTK